MNEIVLSLGCLYFDRSAEVVRLQYEFLYYLKARWKCIFIKLDTKSVYSGFAMLFVNFLHSLVFASPNVFVRGLSDPRCILFYQIFTLRCHYSGLSADLVRCRREPLTRRLMEFCAPCIACISIPQGYFKMPVNCYHVWHLMFSHRAADVRELIRILISNLCIIN